MRQMIVEYGIRTVAGVQTATGEDWMRFVTSTFVSDESAALPPLSSIVPEARRQAFLAENAERIEENDLYVVRCQIEP